MEKINDLTKRVANELAESTEKLSKKQPLKKGLSKTWITALFERFHAIYLNKWVTSVTGIQKVAVEEWSLGLDGLTGVQIKRGLQACREGLTESSWPPSISEFKALCLGKSDAHQINSGAYKMHKELPILKSEQSVGRKHLDLLKSSLH